jgi:hypothetical protein
MATERFANGAQTLLMSALSAVSGSGQTVSVTSAAGFPGTGNFRIRIDDELMLVTAVSGTTWTVDRPIESTAVSAHSAGAPVVQVLTAAAMNALAPVSADQSANTVLAGPPAGGATAPAFRALVTADLPDGGVTDAKLRAGAAASVIGRSAGTAGAPADVAAALGSGAGLLAFDDTADTVLWKQGAGVPVLDGGDVSVGNAPLAYGGTGASLSGPGADRVLFWDESAGQVTWLTAGSGLSIAGATLSATGSGGTVTSVGITVPAFLSVSGSPVTGSGTLAVALATQGANTVLAGPASGGAAAPTFRALATADLPAAGATYAKIQDVSATDRVLGRVSSGAGVVEEVAFTDQAQQLCDDTSFSAMRATLGLAIGSDVQAYDATLAALAAYSTNGLVAQTAADTFAGRTIAGTADKIAVTNGDGVAGNPTVTIAATYAGQTSITTLGTVATGAWQGTRVGLAYGGTNADLSATGGAGQFLRQSAAGAAVTVAALAAGDLPALNGFADADWALDDRLPFYDTSAGANRDGQTAHLLGLLRVAPGGRLTLTSGAPATAGDVTGATTVYYTPYVSDAMVLWDGTRWVPVQFAETALALGTVTSGVPYDVFGYLSSGALAHEKHARLNTPVTVTVAAPGVVTWAAHGMSDGDPVVFTTTGALPTGLSANTTYYVVSSTANTFQMSATQGGTAVTTSGTQSGTHTGWQSRQRGTAVTLQDGRYCKSGDKTRLYLGTFYTTGTTQTEDSKSKRFLWNAYNRVTKHLSVIDTSNSWAYSTAAWRAANNSTANRVQLVRGLDEDAVRATAQGLTSQATATTSTEVGVGLDSTSANSAQLYGAVTLASGWGNPAAHYAGCPGVGFHYLQWLEETGGSGTTTWYGNRGGTNEQTGLVAEGRF